MPDKKEVAEQKEIKGEIKEEAKLEENAMVAETAADVEVTQDKEGQTKKAPRAKKSRNQISSGKVFIKSSFNNTIISVTDQKGNLLIQNSAGASGFKGSKKSTPFAASVASENAIKKAKTIYGISEVEVFVSGVGTGRESAVRALGSAGVTVSSIKDVTPVAHNGCRAKKPRRV